MSRLLDITFKLAVGGLLTASIGSKVVFIVQPGHAGIIFDRFKGVKSTVYGDGMHFVLPYIQWPIIYDTRITPSIHRTETLSKDLQTVRLYVRVLHQPVVEKLPWIYSQVGTDYAERILPSIGNEVLKGLYYISKLDSNNVC